jgi:hypothetical protein
LIVVDERPREVSLFEVTEGSIIDARDEATQRFGNDSTAERALNALHPYLASAWETERTTGTNFRALANPPDLSWFMSQEAQEVFEDKSEGNKLRDAVGFAQSLATGYAFMARYRGTPEAGASSATAWTCRYCPARSYSTQRVTSTG